MSAEFMEEEGRLLTAQVEYTTKAPAIRENDPELADLLESTVETINAQLGHRAEMRTLSMPTIYRECDNAELCRQIGHRNILAISGGRVMVRPTGVTLPVHYGYSVTVDLAADDTYTVRRMFARGSKSWVKGEERGVYCDQVGDSAYRASCFQNVEFGS